MWEIAGAGGVSSGTSSAAREDSDRLQPWPDGPMGSEHPSCRAALPGQAGTWLTEKPEFSARWCFFLLTMFRNAFVMLAQ